MYNYYCQTLLVFFCRTVYQKLGGVVSEDQRQLYTQRVEEITPNLRYCAYNIGGMPTDVTELMKLRSDAQGSDILSSKIDVRLDQFINKWIYSGTSLLRTAIYRKPQY